METQKINLDKKDQETDLEYIWRIGQAKDNQLIDYNWEELSDLFNAELGNSYSESKYRKSYNEAKKFFDSVFSKFISDDNCSKNLNETIRKQEILKKQIQTEKLELNRWLRSVARDELIVEHISEAIHDLPSLNIPDELPAPVKSARSGCLCFGDEHFGSIFKILGLHGEVVNEYNIEIFENRMWRLLSEIDKIIKREGFTEIQIFSLGDFTDGLLRVSQLKTLECGVIESAVLYADFICNWLNELSKIVRIKFNTTDGNHTELRLLNQPKGTFEEENVSIIVSAMIKIRLKDNPNFEFIENPTGLIFTNISGFNVLAIHGEVKNLEKAISDFSHFYDVNIDYLITGHLHHLYREEIAKHKEVIIVPSLMGVNPYAEKILKSSDAAALFLVFEENKGICISEKIFLN